MVTLTDVRGWDPDGIEAAFRGIGQVRDRLLNLDTDLRTARPPANWLGAAADGAGREHERLAEHLRRTTAATTALRPALADAVDTVTAIRRDLAAADTLAAARGYTLTPTGGIDTATAPPLTDEHQANRRQVDTTQLSDRLADLLRRAEQLDTTLAAALQQAAAETIDDGTGTTLAGAAEHVLGVRAPSPPPPGTPPEQVAAWWNSLTSAQHEQLLLDNPAGIGNLDGIPATIRDEANQARLPGETARIDAAITDTQTRLDALTAQQAQHPVRFGEYSPERVALDHHLADLRDQRDSLTIVADTLAADPANRHLLLLDVDGGAEPHAAVAVGDVDTADHVAVYTPGLATTVADSLPGATNDLAALRENSLAQLDRATPPGQPTPTVATVAWLGYDFPEFDTLASPDQSVALDTSAQAGGHDLARFLDGITATRPDNDPHLTALGHSYGSTTTGFALHEAHGVDDAVVFGSPGITTDNPAELNVPPGHLGLIEARDDVVADLGAFGSDPNHLPGITNLSAEAATAPDGTPLAEVTGHEHYLAPGSTSQYNLGATVAGLPDNRIPTSDNSGFGDFLRR